MSMSTRGPVARREAPGRNRLLDAAEVLYARRGIDGVSLREIIQAAHQRNASVVQYHFGSRGGLIDAIVERHMSVVDAARAALIDAAEAAGGEIGPREAMTLLVVPLAERLHSASGRNYLRILQHLVDRPPGRGRPAMPLSESNASISRVSAMLATTTQHLPEVLRTERQGQTTSFLFRALADRATVIDDGGDAGAGIDPQVASGPVSAVAAADRSTRPGLPDHELFVADLIDVLVAVLTTPPSPETLAAARRTPRRITPDRVRRRGR
jgi:AcrR family transcriptional regulator